MFGTLFGGLLIHSSTRGRTVRTNYPGEAVLHDILDVGGVA